LKSGIRVDEFMKIVCLDHPPILRNERGLLQASNPKGECLIAVLRDNRSLNRGKNVDALAGKRAVGLPDLNCDALTAKGCRQNCRCRWGST
jgi:hypothetical protein